MTQDVMNNSHFDTPPKPDNWFGQMLKMTWVETATYLRDKTAIFWTFVYPVLLLMLLMFLFGSRNSHFTMEVDIEGNGKSAEQFVSTLESRIALIEGVTVTVKRVTSGDETPANRVRVILPPSFAPGGNQPTPIVIQLKGAPNASSGSMLSLLSETTSKLNAEIHGITDEIPVEYAVTASGSKGEGITFSVYYVVGLAVLTMITTALFGFTGPLVDLRARGGLKLFQFMPVYRSAFLTGFAMCRVLVMVMFVLLFITGGMLVFGNPGSLSQINWPLMMLLTICGTISFLAAGLALAGVVTSSTIASALINLINLPIMFLSDLFIPMSQLPQAVQAISKFTPVYMLVKAMRSVAVSGFSLQDCLPVLTSLALLTIFSLIVMLFTFRWRLAR